MFYTEAVYVVVVTNEFGDVDDRLVYNEWGNAMTFLTNMEDSAIDGFSFHIETRSRG